MRSLARRRAAALEWEIGIRRVFNCKAQALLFFELRDGTKS